MACVSESRLGRRSNSPSGSGGSGGTSDRTVGTLVGTHNFVSAAQIFGSAPRRLAGVLSLSLRPPSAASPRAEPPAGHGPVWETGGELLVATPCYCQFSTSV